MGEAASTAVLTVEDIGEKFPESKSELKFLVPLQDTTIKIGDKHRFSVQGEETFQLKEAVGKNQFLEEKVVNFLTEQYLQNSLFLVGNTKQIFF